MNIFNRKPTRDEQGKFVKGHPPIKGAGRPKLGFAISDKMNNALNEPLDPANPSYTKLDAIIDKIINDAIDGKPTQVAVALNRAFGKDIDIVQVMKQEKINLDGLTTEELIVYKQLLSKITKEE